MENQLIPLAGSHLEPGTLNLEPASWREFAARIRRSGRPLLQRLGDFTDPVLVAGCQRSGTTMLARVIGGSDGMARYRRGRDDELDAALILSGAVAHQPRGRYCFQTTYLNECYREYLEHAGRFRLIWVLRNPYAVVWSMAHHWGRFAFNELFESCGSTLLCGPDRRRYELFGAWAVGRVRRACLAYNGKVSQVFCLARGLGSQGLAVVDYDDLVRDRATLLPALYDFIGLPYRPRYAAAITPRQGRRLSAAAQALVEELSVPLYSSARALITHRP